jgi:hypothetical protein
MQIWDKNFFSYLSSEKLAAGVYMIMENINISFVIPTNYDIYANIG